MNLREFRKTQLEWGEIIKWEKALAEELGVSLGAVQNWLTKSRMPAPKYCKMIVKSKLTRKLVTLHDLRPDIF